MIRTPLIALLAVLGSFSTGHAGDPKAPIEMPPAPVVNDDFEANLRLDGWILNLDIGYYNSVTGLSQDTFISFGDWISHVDWLVPLGADIRYQRFGFLPDLVALKVSGSAATPGPGFDSASLNIKLAALTLPFYYRVVDQPDLRFDVLAGARLLWVDLDVGLKGGPLGNRLGYQEIHSEDYIWDAIGGLRVQYDINEKLFTSFYGDVGAGDSELTWQFWADVGYRFSDRLSASIGYRYLDYSEESVARNVELTAKGPIIGVFWEF